MEIDVLKTFYNYLQHLLFIGVSALILSGCAQIEPIPQPVVVEKPDITTEYLFKHRIITNEPTFGEKVLSTLPYETTTFDEAFIYYLVARLPDTNSTTPAKRTKEHYYLWVERTSDAWLNFTHAYGDDLGPLSITGHNSSIRSGRFYKNYSVDLSLEQVKAIQHSGLTLTMANKQKKHTTIFLPKAYVDAFLMILNNQQLH